MKALNALRLSRRFAVLIGVFIFGFALYGGWSFKTLADLKVNGPLYQRIVQGKDLVADILPPPEYIIESYLVGLQLADEADKGEQKLLIDRLGALKADYDKRHAFWLAENLDSELKSAFLSQAHEPATVFYQQAFDSLVPAVQKGDREAVRAAMARMKAAYETHRKAIDKVVDLTNRRNENDESEAKGRIESATTLMFLILAMSMAAAIAVAVAITRGLLGSLGGEPEYAVRISRAIAAGDLTVPVETKPGDRTSLLAEIKLMQAALRSVIGQTHAAASQLVDAAQSLAAASHQVAESTGQQSDAAAAMATSVEQMTTGISHVANSANSARSMADEAGSLSLRGSAQVGETIDEIKKISGSVDQSAEVINDLGEQSQKIVGIVGVIQEIAGQTNLLALNAAIEAARAGEQGRGFAVVADEVRKLAEKTTLSTHEISSMIVGIQQGTERAVQEMKEGSARMHEGVDMAAKTGETMKSIESGAQHVLAVVEDISNALREQSAASGQIAENVERIAQMTEENSAAVNEVSQSARQLQQLAGTLKTAVDRFRL